MDLSKVLAVSGKPGLYELKKQMRDGFVVESLVDGKKSVIGMKSNVSLLSEISIYTLEGEVKLFNVFGLIAKKTENSESISHKAPKQELEQYFLDILPTYEKDKVYHSDIKKVFNWYNILNNKGLRFEFEENKTDQKEVESK